MCLKLLFRSVNGSFVKVRFQSAASEEATPRQLGLKGRQVGKRANEEEKKELGGFGVVLKKTMKASRNQSDDSMETVQLKNRKKSALLGEASDGSSSELDQRRSSLFKRTEGARVRRKVV